MPGENVTNIYQTQRKVPSVMKKVLFIALVAAHSCFAGDTITKSNRVRDFFQKYSPISFEQIKDENSYIPGIKTTISFNPKVVQGYCGLISGLATSWLGIKLLKILLERMEHLENHKDILLLCTILAAGGGTALATRKYAGNTFCGGTIAGGTIAALIAFLA